MKRIKALSMALILCTIILACWPAQAWVPDEWYETLTDLPPSVQTLLSGKSEFVSGVRGGDTIFVLFDEGNNTRRINIFREEGGNFQLECESAPLPRWRDSTASIGCSGGDVFYLIYDGGSVYFNFGRMYDSAWKLVVVQASEIFGFDAVGLYGEISGQVLCGTIANTDLSTLNVAQLPATYAEAIGLVDMAGWALVKSDKPTDRLHLRTAPSTDAASIGRYYSGAPVRILEDLGEWAKVSVVGVQGYMMTQFLAFGQDMLGVERWFLSRIGKRLIEEDAEQGVNVYASPDSNSTVMGVLRGNNHWTVHIIATVGDNWYHILCDDGLSGYVEARHFWDGNG